MYDDYLIKIAVIVVILAIVLFAVIPATLFIVSLLVNFVFGTTFTLSYLQCLALEGVFLVLKIMWKLLPPVTRGEQLN
ncbi:MAG: hypothetical protein GYA60_01745 [Candidatus Methanofastidiosa archaeon]|jgi:uncharacterized protein YqfA (UPF0365 family)|nr:hypothetical protein [Candidatus Methanofastidiosa archaeon]